jgi:tetratricopeptide (TPR) repeat protein
VERALASEPAYAFAHRVRSWTLGELYREDEALEAASEAVRHAPGSAESHVRLAWCLSVLLRHEEALTAAERAVTLDPGSARAWNIHGWVSLRRGDAAGARTSYARAAQIDPRIGMRGLALVDTTDVSVDLYRRVLASDASDHVALGNLVLKLCRLGRWEEAFPLACLLVEQHPDYPLGLEVYARSAANSGRSEAAFALEPTLLRRATELAGTSDEYRAYEGLGHIALARGEYAEAQARYGRALALKDWCCLAVGVGRAAAGRGDHGTAREMYERAVAKNRCESGCSLITRLADELNRADE